MSVAEEWRPIPGAPDYEASCLGRIRSVARTQVVPLPNGTTYERRLQPVVLAPYRMPNGYHQVSLGKKVKAYVQRLVALAFHGEPPSALHEVAHRDGNPGNNQPGNLVWATHAENEQHKRDHGTYYTRPSLKGTAHHKAKLTDDDVLAIRRAYTGKRGEITELASRYGVDRSTMSDVVNGTGWRHLQSAVHP